jgi:hypothetical protein
LVVAAAGQLSPSLPHAIELKALDEGLSNNSDDSEQGLLGQEAGIINNPQDAPLENNSAGNTSAPPNARSSGPTDDRSDDNGSLHLTTACLSMPCKCQ